MAQIYSAHEALKHTFDSLLDFISGNIKPGIPTGFPNLDSLTGGLQPGKVVVLAARPSIGKSALALNMVYHIVRGESPKRVLYCSTEMDETEIMSRLLCLDAGISLASVLDDHKPDDTKKLTEAAGRLKDVPLWIDPSCGLSIEKFSEKIRAFADSTPVDLIVIDSVERLRDDNGESVPEGLKRLARDLQLPILELVMLRTRKNKVFLSDLPEGVVDYADTVMFLDRKREKIDTAESGANAMLVVEKNKMGFTGLVQLKFFPALMKFESRAADDE